MLRVDGWTERDCELCNIIVLLSGKELVQVHKLLFKMSMISSLAVLSNGCHRLVSCT